MALPVTAELLTPADARIRLARLYERQLRRIEAALAAGGIAGDAALASRVPEIVAALSQLDAGARAWARAEVPRAYAAGMAGAQQTLIAEGAPILSASVGLFDRAAARALTARTALSLTRTAGVLLDGLVGGRNPTTAEAVRSMTSALAGDNRLVQLTGGRLRARVVGPSGRLWQVDGYARMLGRTAIADARRVSFRARYLQNGVDVVLVPGNGTEHDICAAWEDELLSLTGATPGLATVDDARADGLFHPNCTHRYVVAPDADQPGRDLTPAVA